MHLRFQRQSEAKKLPRRVKEYMKYRFNLLPEYLDMLRCFEYDGQVNGERVNRVRIFNPYKARDQRLCLRVNLDLEQHPEMLCFEGHVDSRGSVYVADRREPLKQLTVK